MQMINFLKYFNETIESRDLLQSFICDDLMILLDQLRDTRNDPSKEAQTQKRLQTSEDIVVAITHLLTAYQTFNSSASRKKFGFIPRSCYIRADEYGKACICTLLIIVCYKHLQEEDLISRYAQLSLESFNLYAKATIDGAYAYEYNISSSRSFNRFLIQPGMTEHVVLKAKDSIQQERKELFKILSSLAWDK